jgi:uncharacterized RDD family membrane protein YckC
MQGYAVGQAVANAPSSGSVPAGAAPVYGAPGSPSLPASAAQSNIGYAGFWLRLVAAIIDGIVISIPLMPVFFLVFIDIFRHAQDFQGRQDPAGLMTILGPKIGLIFFISAIASWLYWGLFESSAWQATLGKKALGIIVTDLEGRRISFGRASGRFWAGRGVGAIPYLGGTYFLIDCICVGFTAKKQAIHDMIASCLVLRKL